MKRILHRFRGLFAITVCIIVWGCETVHVQTRTIFDDSNRRVALQVMPDSYGGKGYHHPVTITEGEMADLLRGLQVAQGNFTVFGTSKSQRVFAEKDIVIFAPLFVQGLRQATPNELVTFFETTELSREYEATTSGDMFVVGDALHIVLSNHRVKTQTWRDVEQYQASYRNRPLERIESQPGRLFHESHEAITSNGNRELGRLWEGKPWQIAIRLKN